MNKTSTGRIAARIRREILALEKMPDSEIDFSDIPEQTADKWKNAVVGKFYRPIKEPIGLRIDADVLAWLKSQGPGYQTRANQILRKAMLAAMRKRSA
jgi:uncharacterized protein (DUF4415 family)